MPGESHGNSRQKSQHEPGEAGYCKRLFGGKLSGSHQAHAQQRTYDKRDAYSQQIARCRVPFAKHQRNAEGDALGNSKEKNQYPQVVRYDPKII